MGGFLTRIIQGPIPAYTAADGSKRHKFDKANGVRNTSDEESTPSETHISLLDPITSAAQDLINDSRLLQIATWKDGVKIKQRMAMKAKRLAGDLLEPEALIGGMAVSVCKNRPEREAFPEIAAMPC